MFATIDNKSCHLFQSSELSRNSFKAVKYVAKNVGHVAHSTVAISGIGVSGEAYPGIC